MASYLITGAARGIGFALVKQLAAMPKTEVAMIFATSRSQSAALKELAGNNADRVIFVELEVTSEASIHNAVKLVEENLNGKGLDVLINNAGMMGTAPGGAPAM
jgi:NAD(P)-dependent dehydrogenase (short-subunit alcohol dehydrogenase family)